VLALDADDVPFALVAVIVNVYAVLDAKEPVTVTGEVVPVTVNAIDGLDTTLIALIVFPPVFTVNGIVTDVPLTTVGVAVITGASGTVVAVTDAEAELAKDVAALFVPVTVNV
jgi:hypothetical protein